MFLGVLCSLYSFQIYPNVSIIHKKVQTRYNEPMTYFKQRLHVFEIKN